MKEIKIFEIIENTNKLTFIWIRELYLSNFNINNFFDINLEILRILMTTTYH